MRKTEREVLAMAYYWADNPTTREAKKALWDAVQADRKNVLKRAEKAGLRIKHEPERA
jgi:hypothetical protein